jgi:hypothetical protein
MALFAVGKGPGSRIYRYSPRNLASHHLTLAAAEFSGGKKFVLKEARKKPETAISAAAQGISRRLENSKKPPA